MSHWVTTATPHFFEPMRTAATFKMLPDPAFVVSPFLHSVKPLAWQCLTQGLTFDCRHCDSHCQDHCSGLCILCYSRFGCIMGHCCGQAPKNGGWLNCLHHSKAALASQLGSDISTFDCSALQLCEHMPKGANAELWTIQYTLDFFCHAQKSQFMLQVWSRHPPTGRHTLPTRADQAPTSDTATEDPLAGLPSDQVPFLSCCFCPARPCLARPCPGICTCQRNRLLQSNSMSLPETSASCASPRT